MNLHLAEIATEVALGALAVLLVDQAGWHMSHRLVVPPNIALLLLPPKCPELNPTENIWQFMRDNWLSNRVFKSYDDMSILLRGVEQTNRSALAHHVPSACAIGPMGHEQ